MTTPPKRPRPRPARASRTPPPATSPRPPTPERPRLERHMGDWPTWVQQCVTAFLWFMALYLLVYGYGLRFDPASIDPAFVAILSGAGPVSSPHLWGTIFDVLAGLLVLSLIRPDWWPYRLLVKRILAAILLTWLGVRLYIAIHIFGGWVGVLGWGGWLYVALIFITLPTQANRPPFPNEVARWLAALGRWYAIKLGAGQRQAPSPSRSPSATRAASAAPAKPIKTPKTPKTPARGGTQ